MSKKLIISISIISFLIIISVWAFSVSSKMTNKLKEVSTNPDITNEKVNVEDLVITETRNGQKFWDIYAKSGHYDNANNKANLTDVKGNFYKNDKVILSFEAPLAIFFDKKKEISLSGGVRAATNSNVYITSKELNWHGSDDLIRATGDVMIRRADQFITYSDSSVFNTEFTKFKVIGKSQTNVYTNN